jgi:uncharacterized protein (DUF111 family)
VLRVYLAEGSSQVPGDVRIEEATILECNMDDMNPEWYTHVSSLLFDAGAADVFMTPVVMKKSRPGHILSVLCKGEAAAKMKEILFTETSSIGLREYTVQKNVLRREIVLISTQYGEVQVKRSYYGDRVVNEKPEFEQCCKLAEEHGVSLEEIRKEIYKHL